MNILRLTRTTLFSTLGLFILPLIAYAAPSISTTSGTVSHGQAITIGGSSFGTHPSYNEGSYSWKNQTYLPAIFKDFEDNSLTSQSFSATGSNPDVVTIQSGGPNNSTGYLRAQYVDGRLAGYGIYQGHNNTSSLYTSFWFMMPSGTEGGKPWRWYFGPNTSNDNLYLATSCQGSAVNLGGDLMANGGYSINWGADISMGTWHKLEIWASEPASTYQVWMDGSIYLDFTAHTGNNIWSVSHTMSPNGHDVEYPDMIDGGEAGCGTRGSFNYDDVYIDYTPARVEICTGSTWASRGICNTQIPTSWSPTSIGVVINQGTFPSASTQYLYVVDGSNTANVTGKQITFGSSGGSSGTAKKPNPACLCNSATDCSNCP